MKIARRTLAARGWPSAAGSPSPKKTESETRIMTAPSIAAKWPTRAPYLLSVLRIVAAFLFIQFGTAKLFAFPAAIMPGGGTAPITSLPGIAGTLETFGGLFLLLGLFTRPVAFVVAGEMAVAHFLGHAPHGFWAVLIEGHPASRFCFVWPSF